jgi:hypothetical protein
LSQNEKEGGTLEVHEEGFVKFYVPLESRKEFFLTPYPEPEQKEVDRHKLFMDDHLD